MTVKEVQHRLAQEQFDKKNYEVVVDLLGGPFPVTNIYLDKKNHMVRIALEGDATVEDEDFEG